MKRLSELAWLCVVLSGTIRAAGAATTLTFDDLSSGADYVVVQNGYGGLQWNNFGVLNGLSRPVTEGYRTGIISPGNVAFNILGNQAAISSANPFNLESGSLTAAFVDGMQVVVLGFVGTTVAYNNAYIVHTNAPAFINFNYVGVSEVRFLPSPSTQFVMDNLTVAVPEPNTSALALIGTALSALTALRKKSKSGNRTRAMLISSIKKAEEAPSTVRERL